MCHEDCELILVDVYWTKGSVFTDTNKFSACYESFQAEYKWLQQAINKKLVQLPNIREVFALGGLGNGLQSLNRYEEAEYHYRKAFEAWENIPGDRKIYVGTIPKWKVFVATNICHRRPICAHAYGCRTNLTKPSIYFLLLLQTGMTRRALGKATLFV